MAVHFSAGTLTGPHHRKRGEVNQDYYGFEQELSGAAFAVADGAGSLELSHVGARLAVQTSTRTVLDRLALGESVEEALAYALSTAREELQSHLDSALMGCTIALAVITEEAWGVAVVGDAFGVISFLDGTHELVEPKSHSEFANITRLLTSQEYEPLIVTGQLPLAAISVASDGLTHGAIKGNEPVAGFWNPIVRRAAADELPVVQLFEHMDKQDRISDDTTLIVAIPLGQ